jgi:hypothetical protein
MRFKVQANRAGKFRVMEYMPDTKGIFHWADTFQRFDDVETAKSWADYQERSEDWNDVIPQQEDS